MIMKCSSCRRKNAPVTQVCKDHANQHPGIWRPLVHTSRVESRAIRLTATYGRLSKWRQRGVEGCFDHSARPRQLPWKATEEERAVVCALRRSTNFARDD